MTKQDLVKKVAFDCNLNSVDVSKMLESALVITRNAVAKGDTLILRGFGTLQPKLRKEKPARIIGTGANIIVPAHYVPYFKPSARFKEQVKNS